MKKLLSENLHSTLIKYKAYKNIDKSGDLFLEFTFHSD